MISKVVRACIWLEVFEAIENNILLWMLIVYLNENLIYSG
jgi:hypothetical protein